MSRSAYDYSLDLLSARPYTVRNLTRKMREKEFPPDDIAKAIERLQAAGLLDDRKFAAEYSRQKLTAGAAIRRVKQDLMRKGIDRRSIDEAVEKTLEDEPVDQAAAIEQIALRKLRTMGDLDDVTRRRRLTAFLARKGYEIDYIKKVVSRILLS